MEPSTPSAERLRDVLAGRYRLDARVAAGGMATVYRARDLTLDRDVAVKVLHPHLVDDPGLRERFRTEARHAARLLHPNIVNVFDTGDGPDGLPWIVMEYVDGPSLREVLRERERLTPSQALAIVEPVARALARAHTGGLVHRDVKPENVVIAEGGTPKIADFGIARALAETSHTQTGMLIGSVHYMAPELLSGKPATAATDQYALGIVLYELLTGEQPLPADNPMAVALRRAQEPVPPPSLRHPDVAETLDAVVLRATASEPGERFDDLGAFADALAAAVPEGPEPVVVHRRDAAGRERTLIIPAGSSPIGGISSSAAVVPADGAFAAGGASPTTVVPPAPGHAWMPDTQAARTQRRDWRRLPRSPAALGAAALALLLVAGAALWAFVLAPAVEAPGLRGLTIAEAHERLRPLEVRLTEGDPAYSREVPKGRIVRQEPGPGEGVRRGGTVTVTLSLGPRMVTMPKIVGQSRANALAALAEHGFDVRVDEGFHDTAPAGTIAAQRPDPGVEIAEGSRVVVYVSKGIEQVEVPAVAGMDRDEALAVLEAAKLDPVVVEQYSDEVPRQDEVISQSVEAGTTVNKGTRVEVHISLGPLTIEAPRVEGKKVDDAQAILEALDLRVRIVEEPRPRVGPFKRGEYGRVEAQDPQPGQPIRRGETVTLWTFTRGADERDDED